METSRKPNIVFITFDSVRADHVGFVNSSQKTTPFLDSLAKKGVSFKRAFSTGPGSSVSFTGMFTSTYPLDYGGYSYIDKPRVLISEAMKAGGYKTIGIHSSPYLSAYFGYNRGWDYFRYANYFSSSSKPDSESAMSPGLRRDTIKSRILKKKTSVRQWLNKNIPPLAVIFKIIEKLLLFFRKILKDIFDFKPAFYTADEMNEEVKRILPTKPEEPLFFWLHYLDAHTPSALFARKKGGWIKIKYYLTDWLMFLLGEAPFLNRFILGLRTDLYDESIRYIDEHIRKIMGYLKSLGIDEENSVFVFCSDHGESFLDHGDLVRRQKLFNENIHIPLFVYGPKYFSPEMVDRSVSLVDLASTIVEIGGVPKPKTYVGKSLFDALPRPVISQASDCDGNLSNPVYSGAAIIENGYKLMHLKDKRYLFSLDDEKERNNLYNQKSEIVRELEIKLEPYTKFSLDNNAE